MLCYVLWRRKQRLKKCSRTLQKQECCSDRRTEEKEYDSSFALSTKYSNSESPTLAPTNVENDQSSIQVKELAKIVVDTVTTRGNENIPLTPKPKNIQRPSSLALSPSFSTRKRPSSFDVFLAKSDADCSPGQDSLPKICLSKGLLKSHSYHSVRDSPMAKRILLKVSWDGVTSESDCPKESSDTPTSPESIKKNDSPVSSRPIRFAESPGCSPTGVLKGDIVRSPTSRFTRRRSSIFRAKEFMLSNTFESNVAKSLMAVVIALSFSVLPLLCMFPQLARHTNDLLHPIKDVSFLVSAVMVLLSNSLWNCLIYGARTRYFRTHLGRTFSKFFNCFRNQNSLTKQLSHIFSTKTSFFNTGNESK